MLEMERPLKLLHTDIKWFEWCAAECCCTSQRQLRNVNCTKIIKCMLLEMFSENSLTLSSQLYNYFPLKTFFFLMQIDAAQEYFVLVSACVL